MSFLIYISNVIIPLLIFYVVATGVARKKNVYDVFIKGAGEGLTTVVNILPTLVGLMVAVGILRASGFLEFIASLIGGLTNGIGLPSQMVPVIIVKMFSSSAATGLVLDIFKEYGPDSIIGMMTSIMMSCTETIFYTMSIYYMTAKVRKTRYTLPGALIATVAGVIASVILSYMMF